MPSPVALPAVSGPAGPPSTVASGELTALADRCVQCGLCLPACPTYGRSALESESPRGRIALARAWALETIPPTPTGDAHLDHCLGCRSCEVVCPAGVEYGHLLVLARGQQRLRRGAGLLERTVLALAARPAWLGRLLKLYRVFHPVLPARLRPLPRPPVTTAAPSADRAARMAVFTGCVATIYEAPLRQALAQLCAALGVELATPAGQSCCGSLHAHAGDTDAATALHSINRAAFSGFDGVLSLASGCHEGVAQALARDESTDPGRESTGTPPVHDAIAWIATRADQLRFAATPVRVALHLPCTQRNVVGSVPDLRRLLQRVPQLEVVELSAGFGCCGAAGLQMLRDPVAAAEYRAPLLEQFERSGASVLLSANIGCRLHLAQACAKPVLHPLEFLAQALDPSRHADTSSNPAT